MIWILHTYNPSFGTQNVIHKRELFEPAAELAEKLTPEFRNVLIVDEILGYIRNFHINITSYKELESLAVTKSSRSSQSFPIT
jgi:hypothetical protein